MLNKNKATATHIRYWISVTGITRASLLYFKRYLKLNKALYYIMLWPFYIVNPISLSLHSWQQYCRIRKASAGGEAQVVIPPFFFFFAHPGQVEKGLLYGSLPYQWLLATFLTLFFLFLIFPFLLPESRFIRHIGRLLPLDYFFSLFISSLHLLLFASPKRVEMMEAEHRDKVI